jgi:hypothetical protein
LRAKHLLPLQCLLPLQLLVSLQGGLPPVRVLWLLLPLRMLLWLLLLLLLFCLLLLLRCMGLLLLLGRLLRLWLLLAARRLRQGDPPRSPWQVQRPRCALHHCSSKAPGTRRGRQGAPAG